MISEQQELRDGLEAGALDFLTGLLGRKTAATIVATGWKGARLTVSFLFYDLRNGAPASEVAPLFQGICNPPDEIREATFRITATNRMSLQRLLLPQVRIQRRCPWDFPATADQRTEALDGGANGKYSRYYRCGYSAATTAEKEA